ncbi:unnamed protein product (macronuclear) [Paramecium tetraurelia]|uniref:Uncharacterized protein n=1 Tax=Paramecium tetraurelia TaxID=5888 RepID=A0CBS4_PARTE|nr:uncharacterized protein GSPATT00037024001 [Paramecium tetraurelia]CAK68241.1 unnamed protein product [Paramecium tetraurelia]|eukprot:XP_001435638.1 hypothetical protein (macronuclear) [Paramecium tetraurelia strain d4-2]
MQGLFVAAVFLIQFRHNKFQMLVILWILSKLKNQQFQVYDHPENTFQFTDVREKTVISQFLNDQKIKMNLIKQKIEQLLAELAIWQSELVQQQTNLINVIKKDEFKSLFQQLTNQDKGITNEVIQELQNKFYHYFQSIQSINQTSAQKDLESLDQILENMNKKIIKSQKFEELFNYINKAEIDYLRIANPFNHLIMSTISKNVKRQIIKKQPIYRSRENGLTFDAIKAAIISKENLLWFFKSSNNGCTEFGAFTPYIWNDSQYSGATAANPSFIFSKTLSQIYPIKQAMGACTHYFSLTQYLIFGGTGNSDQDILIRPDFKSGYSRLGVSYQAPQGLDTSKNSPHLFGALEPNVIECEIYQIIFE